MRERDGRRIEGAATKSTLSILLVERDRRTNCLHLFLAQSESKKLNSGPSTVVGGAPFVTS